MLLMLLMLARMVRHAALRLLRGCLTVLMSRRSRPAEAKCCAGHIRWQSGAECRSPRSVCSWASILLPAVWSVDAQSMLPCTALLRKACAPLLLHLLTRGKC